MFLPDGSQDQIGKILLKKQHVYQIFNDVAVSRGFKAIETPVIEYADTFTNPHVGMPFQQLLKWFDREGEIEVLRPDWTTAIARALMKLNPKESKWFYQGSVFTQDKDGIESRQAGIEMIRTAPNEGEIETLCFAIDYLSAVDVSDYVIELGHTGIYETIIAPLALSVEEEAKLRLAMHDKRQDVVKDLTEKNPMVQKQLLDLIDAYGDVSILERYKATYQDDETIVTIVNELIQLVNVLKQLGIDQTIVDLGRVKQLPYYSGTMFRGYLTTSGEECFSGGRYDKLYQQFNQSIPAIGLAFDVDALASVVQMDERGRVAIIASADTHVLAELKRRTISGKIVDILYTEPNPSDYEQIIDLRKEEAK